MYIQRQHCFAQKVTILNDELEQKKIMAFLLGFFVLYFLNQNAKSSVEIFFLLIQLCWLYSLSSLLCPRFPQSLAFTCTVCILWGPSSSLHYCNGYHHWELCHYQSIYFKSCSSFWWWCWIFKHPPVWQLCNFLVQTFTTYFLGLFQNFQQTFPFVFFEVTVYWIGWIFSFFGSIYFG